MFTIRQFLLLFSFILLSCMHQGDRQVLESASGDVSVKSYGGAGLVSGSMHMIQASGKSVLVDVGIFYPDGDENESLELRQDRAQQRNDRLPFDPRRVDAVVITHAHLDHAGRLPQLIKSGYEGKIYVTEGTRQLLEVMLEMQLRYDNEVRDWAWSANNARPGEESAVTAHWTHCEWAGRIADRNLRKMSGRRSAVEVKLGRNLAPCRQCAGDELGKVLRAVTVVEYDQEIDLGLGFRLTMLDAGHIPGSASALIEVANANGESKRLLFSGDLGNDRSPLQTGPKPAPKVDAVWVETTYGGAVSQFETALESARFQESIGRSVRSGGIVWIPAFALDRTQKVLYLIRRGIENGRIPTSARIYAPSPSAHIISDIYKTNASDKSGSWFKDDVDGSAMFPRYSRSMPDQIPAGSIVITTSGMMDEALSARLLRPLLTDARSSILLVGYADPALPGGQLKAQIDSDTKTVEWEGQLIDVKATITSFGFLSAHADGAGVLQWLSANDPEKTMVKLVHGSADALKRQKDLLNTAGFKHVTIPAMGEVVTGF
jgi:metallo-beta-lactamase family protein